MAEPMMGLTTSDITFAEATPEQCEISWRLRGEAWASPMSIEDYVERERYLSQQELTRDGCRHWVLYLKGYPRQVIASCESTRKRVLISDGAGGPVRESYGYTIANVYTNPAWRRQGCAAFLLRKVNEQLDLDSDCSVLYSDSGRMYYGGLGWVPFPSWQANLILVPTPRSPTIVPQNDSDLVTGPPSPQAPKFLPRQPDRTRPIRLEDLPGLCELDQLHVRARFEALTADSKTHITFLPTSAQIAWQLARSQYDADKMLGKSITSKGAITTSGSSWIYWAHDWRAKRLRILRIVQGIKGNNSAEQRVGDVRVLLEAALAEASAWGLPKVVVWNPDGMVTLSCKTLGNYHPQSVKITFDERMDGCVPSMRWRYPVDAEGKDAPSKGIEWEDNFGYCLS
ncbi:lysine acetyltransferase [Podospora australis]|uniref:Lysine acetyltransferase n=1 Tax=Podospora australis TaxID=1536484 RepID=A0AAN6X3B4_9PEZI|nr:lysine acetyltransferase [Podospora australis]